MLTTISLASIAADGVQGSAREWARVGRWTFAEGHLPAERTGSAHLRRGSDDPGSGETSSVVDFSISCWHTLSCRRPPFGHLPLAEFPAGGDRFFSSYQATCKSSSDRPHRKP